MGAGRHGQQRKLLSALPELDVGMLRHDGLPLAGRRRASRLSEHQEVGGGQGEAGREDPEGDGAAGRVAIAVMDRTAGSGGAEERLGRSGWGAPCPAYGAEQPPRFEMAYKRAIARARLSEVAHAVR